MALQQPPIDIVTVLIAIATAVFGPTAATYVGPYAAIIFGAVLGSAWSATRRPPDSRRMATLGYIVMMVGLALLVTVPLAELIAPHTPFESRSILGAVAAVIGGVGEHWPGLIRLGIDKMRGRLASWLGQANKDGGAQ